VECESDVGGPAGGGVFAFGGEAFPEVEHEGGQGGGALLVSFEDVADAQVEGGVVTAVAVKCVSADNCNLIKTAEIEGEKRVMKGNVRSEVEHEGVSEGGGCS
jgi:hypothetical protein